MFVHRFTSTGVPLLILLVGLLSMTVPVVAQQTAGLANDNIDSGVVENPWEVVWDVIKAEGPICHDPDMPCRCERTNRAKAVHSNNDPHEIAWREHHDRMVDSARRAPLRGLDVVLLGDSMVERWNGTRSLGQEEIENGRESLERFFTKQGGGSLEGMALGAETDTTSNLLYHLENDMIPTSLRPKVWVVLIGTNDLGTDGCATDRVTARIVDILRYLRMRRPTARLLVHGLLPRSDSIGSLELGELYHTVLDINQQLRVLADHLPGLYYMEAMTPFLMLDEVNGVLRINEHTMQDGFHPNTNEGLNRWGPLIVEKVQSILADDDRPIAVSM